MDRSTNFRPLTGLAVPDPEECDMLLGSPPSERAFDLPIAARPGPPPTAMAVTSPEPTRSSGSNAASPSLPRTNNTTRSAFSPLSTSPAMPGVVPTSPARLSSPTTIRRSLSFDNDENQVLPSPMAPTAMAISPKVPPPTSSSIFEPERASSPVAAMIAARTHRPHSRPQAHSMSSSSLKLRKAVSMAAIACEPARPRSLSVRAPPATAALNNVRSSGNLPPRPKSRSGSLKRTRSVHSLKKKRSNILSASASALPIPQPTAAAAAAATVASPESHENKAKLPVLETGPAEFKYISPKILVDVMEGKHDDVVSKLYIIDCRFPYEYEGGHIEGALNLHTTALLEEFFLTTIMTDPVPTIVFHCEFSSKRGPTQCRHLRSMDRMIHAELEEWTSLYYPEMYILQGGYKGFYTLYKSRCNPQAYVSMFDADKETEMERCSLMNNLRKSYKRSRSFSDVSKYCSLARSRSESTISSEASEDLASPAPLADVTNQLVTANDAISPALPSFSHASPTAPLARCFATTGDDNDDDDDDSDDDDVRSSVKSLGFGSPSDSDDDSDFDPWGMSASPMSRPRRRRRTLCDRKPTISQRSLSVSNLSRPHTSLL
ncbi:uncharacterized protein AMSG_03559 [Thecamonas trahens ATCC 50062]|uniref:M-phase inducer phosphatase n=1 Tax=Thecamonas trahens ATCC 50062 TaxID=461836 RepID=A0A0L0D4H2_THETB|nr:hypothetical protein AMSG_03559 [Thecamonas trahens ATCC 50062]KNC47130.1 hypothetical protein AMSG_03559 [Thecamonas trahens ATCC 50062]|eukprot:XP_013759906.1 hypothetical protein AMSG_03559 [Thecamonas trahens ATCC 50062]